MAGLLGDNDDIMGLLAPQPQAGGLLGGLKWNDLALGAGIGLLTNSPQFGIQAAMMGQKNKQAEQQAQLRNAMFGLQVRKLTNEETEKQRKLTALQTALAGLPPEQRAMAEAIGPDALKTFLERDIKGPELKEIFSAGGREQKAIWDPKKGEFVGVGAEKTDAYSPEAFQQRAAIAQLGAARQNTIVNTGDVMDAGTRKFAEKAGEHVAEQFTTLAAGGRDALKMKGDINTLKPLIESADTGRLTPFRTELTAWADSMGVKLPGIEKVPDAEAITAVVSRITPTLRPPGSGSSSDFDAKMFGASLPGLARTKPGNRMIVETLDAFADRKVQEAEIAEQALTGQIDRGTAMRKMRELGPVITEEKAKKMQALAQMGGKTAGIGFGSDVARELPAVGAPEALQPTKRFIRKNGRLIEVQ